MIYTVNDYSYTRIHISTQLCTFTGAHVLYRHIHSHDPTHTAELKYYCTIAVFNNWLLDTHIYVPIKWIWIALDSPSETL